MTGIVLLVLLISIPVADSQSDAVTSTETVTLVVTSMLSSKSAMYTSTLTTMSSISNGEMASLRNSAQSEATPNFVIAESTSMVPMPSSSSSEVFSVTESSTTSVSSEAISSQSSSLAESTSTVPMPSSSSSEMFSVTESSTTSVSSEAISSQSSSLAESTSTVPMPSSSSSEIVFTVESTSESISTPLSIEPSSSTTVGTMEQGGLSEEEMQLAIALPVSVGGYLVILFILAVLVGALRRRGKKQKKGDDDMYNYSAMYTGIEAATVFTNNEADDEGKSAFKPKPMRVSYRPKIPVMSHPLTMAELGTLLESEKSIINEFEAIPTNLISMDDVPPGAESKNRYRNILPNPHTRVPLFLKFGVANSDYINANYIRGSIGTPRSYISTQGPLWNTTPDFWRMIWEQRSSIVVMLTELTENNMTKCHQYWPDEQEGRTAIYDDIEVTLAKRVIEQSYTTTTFLLRHLEKGVTREVLHFWFRAWPDHDVPNTYEPFLNFVQSIRSASSDLPVGPITVHCSAGIGRSGVFLATLLGMESLEECGEVDVLKSVSSMRQDRGGMVQNKGQYVFIHMSLYQYGLWLERTKAPMKSFLVGDFPDSGSHTKLLDED